MKIDIQSIHFDADIKLIHYIEEKAAKLKTFYHGHLDLVVFLKLNRDTEKENKIVELKLQVNGDTLFAEAHDRTFEGAFDQTLEGLISQLKKFKEKHKAH